MVLDQLEGSETKVLQEHREQVVHLDQMVLQEIGVPRERLVRKAQTATQVILEWKVIKVIQDQLDLMEARETQDCLEDQDQLVHQDLKDKLVDQEYQEYQGKQEGQDWMEAPVKQDSQDSLVMMETLVHQAYLETGVCLDQKEELEGKEDLELTESLDEQERKETKELKEM